MADETLANGVNTDLDDTLPVEPAAVVSKSDDSEKARLVRENDENRQKIEALLAQIEALKADGAEAKKLLEERLGEKQREDERSEDDRRALHSISSRAADLETEVSRLQHDLISAVSENEDLAKEIAALREEIGSLKVDKEQYQRESALLHEKVKKSEATVEELRQTSLNGVEDVGVVERESGSAGERLKGFKLPGTTTLAAAGTVAVAAVVVYVVYSRRS